MENQGGENSINRRELLKKGLKVGLAAAAGSSLAGCGGNNAPKDESAPQALPEKALTVDIEEFRADIEEFGWDDANNSEKRNKFVNQAADAYLFLSNSTRVSKSDLTAEDKIYFAQNRSEFLNKVREIEPNYSPTDTQWGYTDYGSKKVFVDMESLQKQAQETNNGKSAGRSLISALWHEWGHLDVTTRNEGQLLNNPDFTFFSPISGDYEPFKYYRGGAIYTDTYYGMLRFEEVLNETITVLRLVKDVKLDSIISARDYYTNGVDFFPQLVQVAGISTDELYNIHATSDFEQLAQRIGNVLPGEADPLIKGSNLFVGIHHSDSDAIRQTGAIDVVKNAVTK